MKYKYLADIKLLENNPRTITDQQFTKLKESIANNPEYFKARPILLSDRTGELVIIGGNMRYRAAKDLGMNWDYEILANEWEAEELIDWGVELPVNIEMIEDDLSEDGLTEDDYIPENVETRAKLGDVWLLGEHRLVCGSSTNITDIDKLMQDKKADLVFTDPPYRMDTNGGGDDKISKNMRSLKDKIEHLCDFEPAEFLNVLPTVFNNNMNAYIFCNKDLIPDYLNWALEYGFSFNLLVWKKPNSIPLGGSHRPDLEYLLLFRKNAIWNNSVKDVNYSKCLEFGRDNSTAHPTMKPVGLIENEILISSNKNSIVLDLFGGSGSTLIACEKLKRICYMMELDPKYCDIILKRWEEFSGNKAVLVKYDNDIEN